MTHPRRPPSSLLKWVKLTSILTTHFSKPAQSLQDSFFPIRWSSWTTQGKSALATPLFWIATLRTSPASSQSWRRRSIVVLGKSLRTTPKASSQEMRPSSTWSLGNPCVWKAFQSILLWVSAFATSHPKSKTSLLIISFRLTEIMNTGDLLGLLFGLQVVLLCVTCVRQLQWEWLKEWRKRPRQPERSPNPLRKPRRSNECCVWLLTPETHMEKQRSSSSSILLAA